MYKYSPCRNILPQEQLCARDVVAEAEQRVLAAKINLSALKRLRSSLGDRVVRDAFKIQCAAVGGENIEKYGCDVLAVVLACGEVFDLIDGLFIAGGRRCCGCSERGGAAESCGDCREELHRFYTYCEGIGYGLDMRSSSPD